MQNALQTKRLTRGELLAEALTDTVAELRLIEAADLVGYIRAEQWANIADLVQSSTELSFKENTLSFACAAAFEMNWAEPPSISLDMEFQHSDVTAFFTLKLGSVSNDLIVRHVWFANEPESEWVGTQKLAYALNAARRTGTPS